MKTWFIAAPLALFAQVALAQDAPPPAPSAGPGAEAAAAPAPQTKRRQGGDMRHCLKLKDNQAIIRCAEPGRRP